MKAKYQHPQLANLCTRLDYNGFYSTKMYTQKSADVNENMSVNVNVAEQGQVMGRRQGN